MLLHSYKRANSGSPISGEKAEELLGKMEDYSKIDDHLDVRPDTITFNTCIKGQSRDSFLSGVFHFLLI